MMAIFYGLGSGKVCTLNHPVPCGYSLADLVLSAGKFKRSDTPLLRSMMVT